MTLSLISLMLNKQESLLEQDLSWVYKDISRFPKPKIRPGVHPYFYFKGIMVYPYACFGSNSGTFTPFFEPDPNSQNKGGSTLHIALKFHTKCSATLHPWNKPTKGGYTINNGVPYFH